MALVVLVQEAVPVTDVKLSLEEIRVCIKALNSMETSLNLQSCSRDFGSEEFFKKLLQKFYDAHEEELHDWKNDRGFA